MLPGKEPGDPPVRQFKRTTDNLKSKLNMELNDLEKYRRVLVAMHARYGCRKEPVLAAAYRVPFPTFSSSSPRRRQDKIKREWARTFMWHTKDAGIRIFPSLTSVSAFRIEAGPAP